MNKNEQGRLVRPIRCNGIISMIIISVMIALIVILDQLSKSYARANLPIGTDVNVFDPIFHFHYHENSGAAWGILQDHPWVFMTLSCVAIVAILVFLFLYRNKPLHPVLRYGLACIAGGGIGNMIDRFAKGYVVDFIEFGFFDFPIFNVADSFVTVGSFAIILYLIIDTVKEYTQKTEGKDAVKGDDTGISDGE